MGSTPIEPAATPTMISAEFRIRLPEDIWVAELSQEFHSATFSLLSGYMMGEYAVELGETITEKPDAVAEAMDAHPSIRNYEQLESETDRVLGKYQTTDTDLYEFVERSAVPIEFPVEVRNGWFEFDLTGTREELDRFQEILEANPLPFELLSIVGTTETESLLTDRQRELLNTAVRKGYFEVPRECTLAELAAAADVDKSTASTVLRRGEATIIKWFLSGPEADARY